MSSTPGQFAIKCLLSGWVTVYRVQTGKPSRYIANTQVNSAFHHSGAGKSSTGLHGWG